MEMTSFTRPQYHYLFSYGTLQDESVQLEIIGRALTGFTDGLPFFTQSVLEVIDGPHVPASRKVRYPIARYSGRHTDFVPGTAFRVNNAELRMTDKYEGAAYKRVACVLRSGVCAWAYVDARSSCVGPRELASPAARAP
jgi:hypothetical protein